MSDRVARLAEIRRKRKAQQGGNATNEIEASVVATKPPAEVTSKLNVTSTEDTETVEKNDQSEKSPDAGQSGQEKEKEEPFVTEEAGEASSSVALREASSSQDESHEKGHTYNSDLKRDLAPYLKRARLDTDRAINRVLQDKFQEATRGHKEEAV
ncbi:hypothetical protein OXX79_000785 [Metschnikowia pulcherrima]